MLNHPLRIIAGLEKEEKRQSTLMMALQQARAIIHLDDRELPDVYCAVQIASPQELFTSLTLYLISLESIATLTKETSDPVNLITALKRFSSMKESECKAISALRNSLAHNFGLCTDNKGYKFTLSFKKSTDTIVSDAKKAWDGSYCNKDESTSTQINVCALIQEAENVVKQFQDDVGKNHIAPTLSDDELLSRFTIITE